MNFLYLLGFVTNVAESIFVIMMNSILRFPRPSGSFFHGDSEQRTRYKFKGTDDGVLSFLSILTVWRVGSPRVHYKDVTHTMSHLTLY